MTINSEWIRKDFKQKYFLFCHEIKTEIIPKTVGKEINIPYLCKVIEIKTL